ncbi:SERINE/THREONINE-PROTEIN KINASE [Salix purpurea]|uniref:SERINE/THREONINE-PROTEIN KINASE n=1 Tax=Salix purpurea TaxID=77065 RepID=A0A9Q0UQQ5_SALPP|nr:SERINE/THREONINE-PROTEIN KINASE [Salix purpurea]
MEQEYDLGAYIGQGKFGSVVLCRSKVIGEEFACKMLRKGEEPVRLEVENMQHVSGHSGVVTLKAVDEDLESFYLCPEHRAVSVVSVQCPEHRAVSVVSVQCPEHRAVSVVSVIKYGHDRGVVLRDIKPETILLATSGQMKLADFGLAVGMSYGQSLRGAVGSPAYVAPEF